LDAKLNFLANKFAKRRIMKTPKIKFFFSASTLFVFGLLLVNCAGFQNASYYPSDGIYGDQVVVVKKTENTNGKYYKQYFQNLDDEYSSLPNDAVYFTDPDAYATPIDQTSAQAQQIPWGGQTTSTDVYIFNNRPAFGFGFNNFGWGFNAFNYGIDPFFYGYNPYNGFGFRNRFYSPWWNGYQPFFNPFYSPFYSPFYYGYAGLHYRPPFYGNYYNNRFYRNTKRKGYNTPYAGLSNSRRGEKTYRNSRNSENRNQRAQNTRQKSNEFATRAAINRLNIGRSALYLNGVPYRAQGTQATLNSRGAARGNANQGIVNGRNLQQYGVTTKQQTPRTNTKGRRFSQSRYTNSDAFKSMRTTTRNTPTQRQNYNYSPQPSRSNYSNSTNRNSSYRSSAPSRGTSSYRGSSSVSRGRSSGRRN